MTDTMQALYRYTAEGRFSSYLTGPVLVLPHRGGLPGGLPGLRQAGADAPPAPARRRAGPPVPPGNRPPGAAGPGAGGHVPGCLDHRPGDPVTCAPAPVPGAQRSARTRPSSPARSEAPAPVPRPAAAAAPPPAKSLCGEPKAPSWFPPPAERTQIIFPGGTHGGKNPSHGATCEEGPVPMDRTLFAPKRSARPLRRCRRGRVPSCRPKDGTGRSLAGMFLGTFRRNPISR